MLKPQMWRLQKYSEKGFAMKLTLISDCSVFCVLISYLDMLDYLVLY